MQLKMTQKRTSNGSKDVDSVNYTQRHNDPNPISYLTIRMDIVKSKVSLMSRINWNAPIPNTSTRECPCPTHCDQAQLDHHLHQEKARGEQP